MDRFQALSTFVHVVDAGSFSAAARRLRVGQPAVSKTVAQLEAHLEVRLLVRSTRGLAPTEAGQRFYEHAKAALQELEEADLAARGAGRGLSGRLRLSAAPTFARLHVIPRLPAFLASHPGLSVDVVLDDRPIDLVGEGIDVSLRLGPLPDSGAVSRRLARSRQSVLATPRYFSRAGRPKTPADLATHEAVLSAQRPQAWTFRRGAAEVPIVLQGRLQLSAAEGLRAAVLADMGVAIASDWMFAPELASGAIERVLVDWTLPELDLWALFPTGRLVSAKARAFAAFVEAGLDPPEGLPER